MTSLNGAAIALRIFFFIQVDKLILSYIFSESFHALLKSRVFHCPLCRQRLGEHVKRQLISEWGELPQSSVKHGPGHEHQLALHHGSAHQCQRVSNARIVHSQVTVECVLGQGRRARSCVSCSV